MKKIISLAGMTLAASFLFAAPSAHAVADHYQNVPSMYRSLHFNAVLEGRTTRSVVRGTSEHLPERLVTTGQRENWPTWIDQPYWMQ